MDKILDRRSKGLGFESHCRSCLEVSSKLRISHCLGLPSCNWVPGAQIQGSIQMNSCRLPRKVNGELIILYYIYDKAFKLAPLLHFLQ